MVYNLGKYRYKNFKIYKQVWLFFYKCIDKGPYVYIVGVNKVNALCDICETEKTFIKLNRYYDNIKEPLRFIVALVIIWLPIAVSCVIASLLSNDIIYIIFTCVWLFILTVARIFWVISNSSTR